MGIPISKLLRSNQTSNKDISGPHLVYKLQVDCNISDVCPAGTYLPVNGTWCKSCEGNTISTENATSCVLCAARRFANEEKTECGT